MIKDFSIDLLWWEEKKEDEFGGNNLDDFLGGNWSQKEVKIFSSLVEMNYFEQFKDKIYFRVCKHFYEHVEDNWSEHNLVPFFKRSIVCATTYEEVFFVQIVGGQKVYTFAW